jgi:hypothetical protein
LLQTLIRQLDKAIAHPLLSSSTQLENGRKFDSSRDRGEPFFTKIGVGEVIKGWDKGMGSPIPLQVPGHQTNHCSLTFSCSCAIAMDRTAGIPMMSVGERAILHITYDDAYGARGMPPMIPGLSNLLFDVELLGLHKNH